MRGNPGGVCIPDSTPWFSDSTPWIVDSIPNKRSDSGLPQMGRSLATLVLLK